MSRIIQLETTIHAPAERCFLLSLSVDLHQESTIQSKEKAIAGTTRGIMDSGDFVTWQAVHFGLTFKMTTKIARYQRPFYFVSEMVKGPFKRIYHQHIFKEENGITTMTDLFEFEAPLGLLGKIAETLFLEKHMKELLKTRNKLIKQVAEGNSWQKFLIAE
ncbi:MAG: SRPBCC family protein [Bacteroidia bacterium]